LKALGSDPADYQLIDMMGTYDNTFWEPVTGLGPGLPVPGEEWFNWGYLPWSIERKPEIWKGNPLPGGSWGTEETSEWTMVNEIDIYGNEEVIGFWWASWQIALGIESHAFAPVTVNSSTVLSHVYNVSKGYTNFQTIGGVITATTVEDFMANLIKKDKDQTLEVLHKGASDAVVTADTLKVTSKDGNNSTHYLLTVADVGLSDDALLVAKAGSGLTVEVSGNTGTVSGVKFGTTLTDLLLNLIKPSNSTLRVIDVSGNLVPMKYTTAENSYMNVKAGNNISLEVVSENSENTITYELVIDEFTNDAAYLYSNVFDVDQGLQLVSLIPIDIKVQTLVNNLMVNNGATFAVVDKVGSERSLGDVAVDDNIIVTSPDGTVNKVYWLNFIGRAKNTEAYVTSVILEVDQSAKTISGIPENTSLGIFLGLITPAQFANLMVLNAGGVEVTSGEIGEGYELKVISGDGSKEVTYILSLTLTPGSEAFITSDVYWVSQSALTITQIPEGTDLTTFLGHITPATGASVVVLDDSGDPLESGDIVTGCKVQVTSQDLSKVVTYDLYLLTSIEDMEIYNFNIYPNPATDELTIEGLRDDSKVYIINMLGSIVKIVDSNYIRNATISVEDLTPGIYFIFNKTEDYKSYPVKLIIN